MLPIWLACAPAEPPKVLVPVAARDLPVGEHIEEDDLRWVPTPPELVPPGAVLDPAQVLQHVPSSRILAGEPIRPERLADRQLQVALERLVPPGLEVTVLGLDPSATHVPAPGAEPVDVVNLAGEVILASLPVLRVDGDQVAVMATPEQVRELTALRRASPLAVRPSRAQELR